MIDDQVKSMTELIQAARGQIPVDFLIEGGNLVNVLSGEIYPARVAVYRDRVVGFGDYEARQRIDLKGRFICPGLIDGHLHLESTLLSPAELAKAVVPLGTSLVVLDPHEIANVLGVDGLRYLRASSLNLPLSFYFMLPSCVPATSLETSGARLEAEDLEPFFDQPWVLGLGEVMNFPGVLSQDEGLLKKMLMTKNKRQDGHAPLLRGRDLYAYVSAGLASDHECSNRQEAEEKLRAGMYIMIREGSAARNLKDLLPMVTKENSRRCLLVSDDKSPTDLVGEGHLNSILKKAIAEGLDPVTALQMVTINPAEYFGLPRVGAVAPGYLANLVVMDDLKEFKAHLVFKSGQKVAEKGVLCPEWEEQVKLSKEKAALFPQVSHSVHLKPLARNELEIPSSSAVRARIIQIIPNQIITKALIEEVTIKGEKVVSDPSQDILKLVVVERHIASGRLGLGLVKGMGLREGALASSVAHDSHNIIAVGVEDEDMLAAIGEVERLQGGWVISRGGKVAESLPLPMAGLMSNLPLPEVVEKIDLLHHLAQELGCRLREPFFSLSFLALPVIPELKLTDLGLVDVNSFQLRPLLVE